MGGDHPFRTDLNFYVIAINNLVDAVKVIRSQYSNLPDMLSAVDHAVTMLLPMGADEKRPSTLSDQKVGKPAVDGRAV
jgi:hypothetical protein